MFHPPDMTVYTVHNSSIKSSLLPYVRDRGEREVLLMEAFYLHDPLLPEIINFGGWDETFLCQMCEGEA